MSNRAVRLEFKAPAEAKDKLVELAKQRERDSNETVNASDLMREALEQWFTRQGESIDVGVNRGGDRREPQSA